MNVSDDGSTVTSLLSRVTDTVTASAGARVSATVYTAAAPPAVGVTTSDGSARPPSSSFSIVSVAAAGADGVANPPATVADTVTRLSGDTTALFTAVTVTRPALDVAAAAIVSVVPACV